jgi:hypothetical protein
MRLTVSHATRLLLLLVLVAVTIGGVAAVRSITDTSTKIAVGFGAVAAVIAIATLATGPDWDKISDDIAGIRRAVEAVPPAPPRAPEPERPTSSQSVPLRASLLVLAFLAVYWIRSARRG